MRIKGITDEDFINYKLPSMFISTSTCDFKCDKESGKHLCQNCELVHMPDIEVWPMKIVERYESNPITKAIVFGGLEPFDQFVDLITTIAAFRIRKVNDDIVIYTGYCENEIADRVNELKTFGNIIIKYGRFVPDQDPHFDEVLGVNLASDNQYAKRIA